MTLARQSRTVVGGLASARGFAYVLEVDVIDPYLFLMARRLTGDVSEVIVPMPLDVYWDPVAGNDSASGLTALTPVKTWREIESRWIRTGRLVILRDTTIHQLDDQPGFDDPVTFDVMVGKRSKFKIVGETSTIVSGTVATVTSRDRATNTNWQITDPGIPDFTTYNNYMIVNSTNSSRFWIIDDLTVANRAYVSEPMLTPNPPTQTTPTKSTIAAGNVYSIRKLPKIVFGQINVSAIAGSGGNQDAICILQNLWASKNPAPNTIEFLPINMFGGMLNLIECRFDQSVQPFGQSMNILNCNVDGVAGSGRTVTLGGITRGFYTVEGRNIIDGDMIMSGGSGAIPLCRGGSLLVGTICSLGSIGLRIDYGATVFLGASNYIEMPSNGGCLWGSVTTVGVRIHAGGKLLYRGDTVLSFPITPNTFELAGRTQARGIDPTTGTYTSLRSATFTNLAGPISTGFDRMAEDIDSHTYIGHSAN